MKSKVKFREEDADGSSPFCHLPDEIILQIINRLTDLKTLCFCYLVSRRFSSIVLQVESISFSDPLINPRILDTNTVGDARPSAHLFVESFLHAMNFLIKFEGLKSLHIEFPSFVETSTDNRCLFNWMVKFGCKIESFVFLSPDSISDINGWSLIGNGDNQPIPLTSKRKTEIWRLCIGEVMVWHVMLLKLVKNHRMLEKVSITDTGRRGRLSLSGEKLNEVKKWLHSNSEFVMKCPSITSAGYIPVLNLPVSRYVMKGICVGVMEMEDIQGGIDFVMNSESGFEDAAYTEAAKEILENYMDRIHRVNRNVV